MKLESDEERLLRQAREAAAAVLAREKARQEFQRLIQQGTPRDKTMADKINQILNEHKRTRYGLAWRMKMY